MLASRPPEPAAPALAQREDAVLRRVFAFTLDPAQADPRAQPPVVFLQDAAEVGVC